jgi:hypothetical protein
MEQEIPYEQSAANGKPIPDDLTNLADTALYIALRGLYGQYRSGRIGKEQAISEKRKLVKDYFEWKADHDLFRKISRRWKELSELCKAYTDDPCVETADRFIGAVYGLKDGWRLNNEKRAKQSGLPSRVDTNKATSDNA